jgi:hypothetical protein
MDTALEAGGLKVGHGGIGGNVASHLDRLRPGEKDRGSLLVGCSASGQPIAIPYLVARGADGGPCLWVNAAVHGDEINGVLAAVDFFAGLDANALKGKIVVTPVANPLGFDARRKRVPQDELDLDQSFPGRPDGLISERLAWTLFQEMDGTADVVVSFHTMNPYFESNPYAVYKIHPEARATETDLLTAIACFTPAVACRMSVAPGSQELPGNNAGALDYQSLKIGCTAFMIELGAGSRQQPAFVRQGVDGLRRLAAQLGMTAAISQGMPRSIRRVTRRTHVTAAHGGLFRAMADPAAVVRAGTPIGRIHDMAGRMLEEVVFDQDTIVIGVRTDPVVHSGDRVAFVALDWDDVDVDG